MVTSSVWLPSAAVTTSHEINPAKSSPISASPVRLDITTPVGLAGVLMLSAIFSPNGRLLQAKRSGWLSRTMPSEPDVVPLTRSIKTSATPAFSLVALSLLEGSFAESVKAPVSAPAGIARLNVLPLTLSHSWKSAEPPSPTAAEPTGTLS